MTAGVFQHLAAAAFLGACLVGFLAAGGVLVFCVVLTMLESMVMTRARAETAHRYTGYDAQAAATAPAAWRHPEA